MKDFLKKLLNGQRVEWKKLGEVGEFVRCNGLLKTDFTEYGVPAIHYGQIYTHYAVSTESTISFVSTKTAEKLKKVNTGDVIIRNTSQNFENVGKALLYLGNEQAVTGGSATIFKPSEIILGKYFAYFTQTATFEKLKKKYTKGVIVIGISTTDLAKIPIPIPPLSVQQEIVRILDRFTEPTAELTAELTARKKQYSYYRDKLLTFEDGEVEWKRLGEVAKIQRGASPRPIQKYITESKKGIPWIKIGDTLTGFKYVNQTKQKITIDGSKKSRLLKKGDFIISNSMSFGRPYILNIDGCIHDGWASVSEFLEYLNPHYLYYFLSLRSVQCYWESSMNSGSVSNLNADIIKNLPIPIPPLPVQREIVEILDKFDALTNSISEGLPKEIELRQKQYEYYRNELLNFET